MIRIVIFVLCLAGSLGSCAQQPDNAAAGSTPIVAGPFQMSVTANPTSVLVAQAVDVKLVIDAPAGSVVTLPPIDKQLGPFDVLDVGRWNGLPHDRDQDRRKWICIVRIESLLPGDFQVPPLDVACRNDDEEIILKSKPVSIQVRSSLEDGEQATEIRQIKSVVDVEVPQPRSWTMMYFVMGIVAIGLAAGGAYRIRRRGSAIAPCELASRQLNELRAQSSELTQADCCARLSRIVRTYVQQRTGIEATTLSSEELREQMAALNRLVEPTRGHLNRFLEELDQTRYGGAPLDQLSSTPVDRAWALIKEIEAATSSGESPR